MPPAAGREDGRVNRAVVRYVWYDERLEIALRVYRDEELVEVIVWDEEHDFLATQLVDEGVALAGAHAVGIARVTEVVGTVCGELGELYVNHVPARHSAKIPLLARHALRLYGRMGGPRAEL